jgi:hypothetical protein
MASNQQTNIASLIKVFQASFADRVSLYLALIYTGLQLVTFCKHERLIKKYENDFQERRTLIPN